MRRVAASLLACLLLATCTSSGPQAPSTTGTRTVFGGIHRKLSHDQKQRYEIHIKQTLVARGPQIETAPRVSELRMIVEESVFAPKGAQPSVSATVVEATATGADADAEKAAAHGRSVKVSYSNDAMSFDFMGKQIGRIGELRIADAGMMAYLLTPTSQKRTLLPTKKKPAASSDAAQLPPGWSADDLQLAGSSSLLDQNPYQGHRATTVSNSHSGTANMDLAVFDDASPGNEKFDPVANGYFSSLFRSDPAINNSPLKHLFLTPVAVIDVFAFVFGCIFTLGFFPGCSDETEQDGHVTIALSGPISFEQTATLHAGQGIPIAATGRATMKVEGRFPEPPAPLPGTKQAKGARTASALSGAPISIEATWEVSQKLAGPIPDDGLWWLPLAAVALGIIAVIILVVALVMRRKRRSFVVTP